MKKIYDTRSDFNREKQGADERLTIADYPKIPEGAFFVNYSQYRDTSRWVTVERKRPYEVAKKGKVGFGWTNYGWFKTLEAAIQAAQKLANE